MRLIEDGGLIKGEVSPNKISLPRDMPIRPTTNPKDDKPKVKNSEPIKTMWPWRNVGINTVKLISLTTIFVTAFIAPLC